MRLSEDEEAFMSAWLAEDAERTPRHRLAETQPAIATDAAGRAVEAYWRWIPRTCANGHPLGAGQTNLVYVTCLRCPASKDDRGHHVAKCRVIGCDAPFIPPPGHLGPIEQQR
jgi:hypothetical protein